MTPVSLLFQWKLRSSSRNVCLDCIDWLDGEKSFFIIKLETWNIPSCILSKQRNDCLMFANFQHLLQVIWEENNPAEIFENSAGIWKVFSIFSNNSLKIFEGLILACLDTYVEVNYEWDLLCSFKWNWYIVCLVAMNRFQIKYFKGLFKYLS